MSILSPNIPAGAMIVKPQAGPQTRFLTCSADIVFYGGAAGGGKSYGLLLEPLYDIGNRDFGAVIFRRTTKHITNEGGLWDTAESLYRAIGGLPNQNELCFKFPTGAKVGFAHMEHEKHRFGWQGSQIPLIGFDELTHFTWKQFNYMLSRNRSTCGARSRIRATLNPDPDHFARQWIDWYIDENGFAIPERSGVIRWFIVSGDEVVWRDSREELLAVYPTSIPKSFTFIPSKLSDNKILMEQDPTYLGNLQAMTRVERARLLDGNWNIRPTAGSYFKRSDFQVVDALPKLTKICRAWDQAGSIKKKNSDDPDYTAGCKMGQTVDGDYIIIHMERFRCEPPQVDSRIKNIAEQDGTITSIRLAQDPGQAGKSQKFSQTKMLSGFNVVSLPVTGDKETRAKPFAAQVQAGNVKVLRGEWNEAFFGELENFPEGVHDDQVDAASDAFDQLVPKRRVGTW